MSTYSYNFYNVHNIKIEIFLIKLLLAEEIG